MLKNGIKKLQAVEERLSVDFEDMLDGALDLYFGEHMDSFPSPSCFFAMAEDLAIAWYEQRFEAEIKLLDKENITLSINELIDSQDDIKTI